MKNKGFTLVELLVTISILGILTVIAIPTLRALQTSNAKTQYESYKKSLNVSGKLYNDSYSDDLFGQAEYGCQRVELTELMYKKVAKDIELKDVTCNIKTKDSFVLVRKFNKEYKYGSFLYCENNNHVEQYSDKDYDVELTSCVNDSGAPTVTVNVVEPKDESGSADERYAKNKSAIIVLSDNYGFTANQSVKYAWSTASTASSVAASSWKTYKYNNAVKKSTGGLVTLKSASLNMPDNTTGKYYLYVTPVKVQNILNNSFTETQRFGPFRFDHTAPGCGQITVTPSIANGAASKTLSFAFTYASALDDLKTFKFQLSYDNGSHWETAFIANQKTTTSYTVTKDGRIKYKITDLEDFALNKTNECSASSGTYIRDNVAPVCTLTGPASLNYNAVGSYTYTCTDALSGISSKTLASSNFSLSKLSWDSVSGASAVTNGFKYTVKAKATGSSGNATITANEGVFVDKAGNKSNKVTATTALKKAPVAAPTNSYCKSVTYTGSSQTLTKTPGTGYTFSGNTGTNAGSYNVTATLKANYVWSDGTTAAKKFTCTIAKAKTAKTGSCYGRTYNGSSQTLMGGGSYVSYSGNTRTAAGSQTVTIKSDSNHTFSDGATSKTKSCSIARAKSATTGNCYGRTYNGNSQTLMGGGSHVSYTNNTRTAAGNQTVTITAGSNYAFSDGTTSKTKSCSIARKKSATTGSCRSNLKYNGSNQTLASGGANVTYSNNSQKGPGTFTVGVTAKSNYAFSDGTTSKSLRCTISQSCPGPAEVSGSSGTSAIPSQYSVIIEGKQKSGTCNVQYRCHIHVNQGHFWGSFLQTGNFGGGCTLNGPGDYCWSDWYTVSASCGQRKSITCSAGYYRSGGGQVYAEATVSITPQSGC